MYNKKMENEVYRDINIYVDCGNALVAIKLKGLKQSEVEAIFEKTEKELCKYDTDKGFDIKSFNNYTKALANRVNEKGHKLNDFINSITSQGVEIQKEILKLYKEEIFKLYKERLELLVELDIYNYLTKMWNKEVIERNKKQ